MKINSVEFELKDKTCPYLYYAYDKQGNRWSVVDVKTLMSSNEFYSQEFKDRWFNYWEAILMDKSEDEIFIDGSEIKAKTQTRS